MRSLTAWQLGLAFLLSAILVFSRRPDALLDPQFRAEDGTVWFAQAYNFGWFHAVWHPEGGYFTTLSGLAAAAALLVPLRFAPLVLNLIGLAVQVLPVVFLLSSRCASWGSLRFRAVLALPYIALPDSFEVHVTITCAQWHLAFLSVLIVLTEEPRFRGWRIFDVCVLLMGGLTGPFCIPLSFVALLSWLVRRGVWRAVELAIVSGTAVIQGIVLLIHGDARQPGPPLGASPMRFIRILGSHVYLGSVIGGNGVAARHGIAAAVLIFAVTILGSALVVYGAIRGGLRIRLLLFFALMVFAASLTRPMESAMMPQWESLLINRGTRYWFFPTLAFLWTVIWCARRPHRLPGKAAACVLIFTVIGAGRNWRYPPYPPSHFSAEVEMFSHAPPGSIVKIPIYPNWTMELRKKKSD